MKHPSHTVALTALSALIVALAIPSDTYAGTVTWNNTGPDWFDDANWDGGNHPGDGDHAVINSGTILLTNQTAQLASLTMAAGTLTFSNWLTELRVTNVTINGGSVTHVENSDTNGADGWALDARVWITCSNLTVASGASISAPAKGYQGGALTGDYGSGPGALSVNYAGAGHGGHGGSDLLGGGNTYGLASMPTNPGSGGAHSSSGVAGDGGGAVRIDAVGTVTVGGSITADGSNGGGWHGAGGSGGSVWLTCHTLAGSGTIRALGGNGHANGGGGGGGRIAVGYDTAAQATAGVPGITFSVAGGTGGAAVYASQPGDIGTLYFTDNLFLSGALAHKGQWVSPAASGSWSLGSLTLSSGHLRFLSGGVLTVTNDVLVSGSGSGLDLGGAAYQAANNAVFYEPVSPVSSLWLRVGGDLTLTNGASLRIYSAPTNGAVAYGGLVSVTGALRVADGCWVYPYSHWTNGGSVWFEMADLQVASGGGFDANAKGYNGGPKGQQGFGPGGLTSGGLYTGGAGAGYGGSGGDSITRTGGPTYGSRTEPDGPGSGGDGSVNQKLGGDGGGLLRIAASGVVALDGTLMANGGKGVQWHSGGGSGGGIYIRCHTFSGSGFVQADGGAAGYHSGGAGGGGRVAVWRVVNGFSGEASATGGVGTTYGDAGQTGTVVFVDTGPVITNLWATNVAATTADLVGELTATGQAPVQVTCYWGPDDKLTDKMAWATNVTMGWREVGVLTNHADTLSAGALYYFRFYATNAYGDYWAAPSSSFSTLGGIGANNDGGASDITDSTATLRGVVTAGNPVPASYFCWGPTDPAVDDTSAWSRVDYAATLLGPISIGVSNLLANKTYYYRCYVTNSGGSGWAASATNFTTGHPWVSINNPAALVEGDAGTTDLDFTVSLSTESAVDVTVLFATADGWAEAPADYTATNGVLTLSAGQTAGTIAVPVVGDTLDEHPYQDFTVDLSAPTNGTLADAQGLGVIADDDDQHQVKTWTGVGNWNSFTNWSPTGSPGAADDAVVATGQVTLSNAVTVASLTVNAGSVVFTNWHARLTATGITVNAGTITHVANGDTNGVDGWALDARVWLACSNLTIGVSGSIDVSGGGYRGGELTGDFGSGPGALSVAYSGSGHGGHGGGGGMSGGGGPTYGSASSPTNPGSGGSRNHTGVAGDGGGVVRIDATGMVNVDGTIAADGTDGGGWHGAGGSGGSVWLTCLTLEGDGVLRADGGSGHAEGGAGGGGRIAVTYSPSAQAAAGAQGIALSADGGAGGSSYGNQPGDLGTLHFPDNQFLAGTISHRGQWVSPSASGEWSLDALSINGGSLRFSIAGGHLTVTQGVSVAGSGASLELGGNAYRASEFTQWYIPVSQPSSHWLRVGGDLTLTNGASLRVYAAPTNGLEHGALVCAEGNMHVADGCWVYPHSDHTNGGAARFEMTDLRVDAGAGFDADARGYGAGAKGMSGYGPGATTSGGNYYSGAGAGHGGAGGTASVRAGGLAYGSSNAPVQPGSGGDGSAGQQPGGDGGGAVRIAATGAVTLEGTLTANGEKGRQWHGGGGAGGSIWITCDSFAGNGAMGADGGNYGPSSGGEGGGGRIAVWYGVPESLQDAVLQDTVDGAILVTTNLEGCAATTSVQAGSPGTVADGQDGTVVFLTVVPPGGTVFMLR